MKLLFAFIFRIIINLVREKIYFQLKFCLLKLLLYTIVRIKPKSRHKPLAINIVDHAKNDSIKNTPAALQTIFLRNPSHQIDSNQTREDFIRML